MSYNGGERKAFFTHTPASLLYINKARDKATCMSFPLVGNLSDTYNIWKSPEGFWTSQNDSSQAINLYALGYAKHVKY
jgi:hypothetical protein